MAGLFCACVKHIYISIIFYCHLANDIELYNKYFINFMSNLLKVGVSLKEYKSVT